MNSQLALPFASMLHDAYVASHDVPAVPAPANVTLSTYQECVYVQYVGELDWTIAVMESYTSFMYELLEQWMLLKTVMRVEFCDEDPTPLTASGAPSYRKFVNEVRDTGTLRVFRSQGKHPVLDQHEVYHNGRHETLNSIFRAVHDFFGHLASGGHFGWMGETQAYYSHLAMFSANARMALFNETVAQQCYYAVMKDFIPEDRAVFFEDYWLNPPLGQ